MFWEVVSPRFPKIYLILVITTVKSQDWLTAVKITFMLSNETHSTVEFAWWFVLTWRHSLLPAQPHCDSSVELSLNTITYGKRKPLHAEYQNAKLEIWNGRPFFQFFMNLIGHVYKGMHHAEILIGHFREIIGNWPVASCYFALWVWSWSQVFTIAIALLHYLISYQRDWLIGTYSYQAHNFK